MTAIRERVLSGGGTRVARLDRRPVTHRMILRVLPAAISRRFDPDAAGDLRAVYELAVRDPRGREPARFELTVAEGRCVVNLGPASDPDATATLGADDLIRMASGAAGFPFLALRFPALFRLPARPAAK
jgi:hypothetical protein